MPKLTFYKPDAASVTPVATTRATANAYDAAWQSAWVATGQALYTETGKTVGKVLWIGDSFTTSSALLNWARLTPTTGNGQTAEDDATLAWMYGREGWDTPPADGIVDADNTSGLSLATKAISGTSRTLTAKSGASANDFLVSAPSGSTASMAAARTWLLTSGNATIPIDVVIKAFGDAQFAVVLFSGVPSGGSVTDLTTICDRLATASILPILETLPYRYIPGDPAATASYNSTYVDPYNANIRSLAQTRGYPMVDTAAEFNLRQPVVYGSTLLQSDGVHPSGDTGGYTTTSSPYMDGGNAATHATGNALKNVGYLLRFWLVLSKLVQVKALIVDPYVVAVPPAAPSGLTATASGSSQINLGWTDNSTNETAFVVERSPNGSTSWATVATKLANTTTHSDTGLTASTAYYYRVKATNAAGSSAYTSTATATTGVAGTRTVINPATDMTWHGMARLPAVGTAASGGPGTTSYSSSPLAVRYVSGQRRLLTVLFSQPDLATSWHVFGDLVEYDFPVGISLYTGSTPGSAPALTETRRWSGWHLVPSYPDWQDAGSGTRIGGIYWDESTGRLWYQAYGYYMSKNSPFLGATALSNTPDTVKGGTYATTGTRYGPWYYRFGTVGSTAYQHWKAVCNWIIPIPSYAQSDTGCTIGMGGAVGSVATQGHWGPGLHGFAAFPNVADAPASTLALGTRLIDYTADGGAEPARQCRRDANYDCVLPTTNWPGTSSGYTYTQSNAGLYDPVGGVGYWQSSQDQVNSFAWVDTGTKHGIITFGRRVNGKTWYGHNPIGPVTSPPDEFLPYSADGGTYSDPTMPLGYGNSQFCNTWGAAIRVFDPAHVMAVGRGERSPYSDGMRPVEPISDWKALWPNIPLSRYEEDAYGTSFSRVIHQYISNTAVWDAAAQELIWAQPVSEGVRPTIHVFTIGG